jgi:hypothetical protein
MYKQLNVWKDNYSLGRSDQLAVQDFVECENDEVVRSLRSEVTAIANGSFNPETLNALLGKGRAVKHGSWDNWAKLMLQWMAGARRQ